MPVELSIHGVLDGPVVLDGATTVDGHSVLAIKSQVVYVLLLQLRERCRWRLSATAPPFLSKVYEMNY